MKEFLKTRDVGVGLILLFLSLIFWYFIIPNEVRGITASLLPRVYIACLGFLGILLIVRSRSRKQTKKQDISKPQNDRGRPARVIVIAVILIIYILLMDFLGYFISTLLALLSLMLYLGLRNWKVVLAASVTTVVFIYCFFKMGMNVQFPQGSIF